MKFGVPARSLFARLALRGFCLAGSLVIFSSCAHRTASSTAATALPPGGTPTKVSNTGTYRSISSAAPGEAADRIISLVETGRLVQSGDSFLIFARNRTARPAQAASLYEDAIVLARLRGTLKTVPGIPHSSFREATVHNGGAIIPIKDTLPASTTADIVDTALTVDQVRSVRINLPTAPR